MKDYYKRRAEEYEEIYHREDPMRQGEQAKISEALEKAFDGLDLLEIACGTGYWTVFASKTAKRITATDAVNEVLDIARQKEYQSQIEFRQEDAYKLSFPDDRFTGGLANFWFSHIPKHKIKSFFMEFCRVLRSGSTVFMADNVYLEGIGGELIRKKGDANTYKLRILKDGSESLVIKNYYSLNELVSIFQQFDPTFTEKNVFYGRCFWYLSYRINKNGRIN